MQTSSEVKWCLWFSECCSRSGTTELSISPRWPTWSQLSAKQHNTFQNQQHEHKGETLNNCDLRNRLNVCLSALTAALNGCDSIYLTITWTAYRPSESKKVRVKDICLQHHSYSAPFISGYTSCLHYTHYSMYTHCITHLVIFTVCTSPV